MTDEPFIKAILADPDDDSPRLIYADWLEGEGRAERAEFIRVQCALAAHDAVAKGNSSDPMPAGFLLFSKREALHRRERELLNGKRDSLSNRWRWYGPDLLHVCDKEQNQPDFELPIWRRGFVEAITVSAERCLSHLDAILAAQPVREVTLTTWPNFMSYNDEARQIVVSWLEIGEGLQQRVAHHHTTYLDREFRRADIFSDGATALLRTLWPTVKTWHLPPVASEEDARRIRNAPDGGLIEIQMPVANPRRHFVMRPDA